MIESKLSTLELFQPNLAAQASTLLAGEPSIFVMINDLRIKGRKL